MRALTAVESQGLFPWRNSERFSEKLVLLILSFKIRKTVTRLSKAGISVKALKKWYFQPIFKQENLLMKHKAIGLWSFTGYLVHNHYSKAIVFKQHD